MTTEQYPKIYLYKRIVQAKLFIDNNYAFKIDLANISDKLLDEYEYFLNDGIVHPFLGRLTKRTSRLHGI